MVSPTRTGWPVRSSSPSIPPPSTGGPPAEMRESVAGSEAAAGAVRERSAIERKGSDPIPIVRAGAVTGGSPAGRPLAAAPGPMPSIAPLGADPRSLPTMHEGIVRISTTHRVLMRRALVAEMDEGLVIALRGPHADGVCSVGFASCLAVMLSNSRGVGLVHASGVVDFDEVIQDTREEFSLRTGQPARLMLGYNLESFREQLWNEAQRTSAAAFARDYAYAPAAGGGDETAQKARVIQSVLTRHQRSVECLARNYGADCILMPRSFMALETNGTLHLFEGATTGIQFRPVT